MIIWKLHDNKQTNKQSLSSNDPLMIICYLTKNKQTKLIICCLIKNKHTNKQSLSSGDHLLIIWWSSVDHVTLICCWMNKQTNVIDYLKLISWSSDYLIIWWSDEHLCIVSWQKQTKKKAYHLVIICWSFDDQLLIIWQKKSLSSGDNLMIIWWSSVVWQQTNK